MLLFTLFRRERERAPSNKRGLEEFKFNEEECMKNSILKLDVPMIPESCNLFTTQLLRSFGITRVGEERETGWLLRKYRRRKREGAWTIQRNLLDTINSGQKWDPICMGRREKFAARISFGVAYFFFFFFPPFFSFSVTMI